MTVTSRFMLGLYPVIIGLTWWAKSTGFKMALPPWQFWACIPAIVCLLIVWYRLRATARSGTSTPAREP